MLRVADLTGNQKAPQRASLSVPLENHDERLCGFQKPGVCVIWAIFRKHRGAKSILCIRSEQLEVEFYFTFKK